MTTIAHIFAAIGIFFGSLFGASGTVSSLPQDQQPAHAATSTVNLVHKTYPPSKDDPCASTGEDEDVVVGNVVCSYGDVVQGADGATFTKIQGDDDIFINFFKDAHAVYADDVAIPGADPATFSIIGYGYVKDRDAVYCGAGGDYPSTFGAIPGADPATFTILGHYHEAGEDANFFNDRLAKDSKTVYSQCVAIPDVDPATFTPIYLSEKGLISGYAKDANHVWDLDGRGTCVRLDARGDCPVVNETPELMPEADPASFRLLESSLGYTGFAVDAAHVYVGDKIVLSQADPATFADINSSKGNITSYEKDKNNVFFEEQGIVSGADVASFVAKDCGDRFSEGADDCSTYDAYDKNHRYQSGEVVQ